MLQPYCTDHESVDDQKTTDETVHKSLQSSRVSLNTLSYYVILLFSEKMAACILFFFFEIRKVRSARKNDPFISLFELNGVFVSSMYKLHKFATVESCPRKDAPTPTPRSLRTEPRRRLHSLIDLSSLCCVSSL